MKLLISLIMIFISTQNIYSVPVSTACKLPFNQEYFVAGIGDSRAWQMEVTQIIKGGDDGKKSGVGKDFGNALIHAINPNSEKLIIDSSNQLEMITRAVPGTATPDWIKRIKYCDDRNEVYEVPTRTFMHIGNDLAAIMQSKKKIKEEYEAFRFVIQQKALLDFVSNFLTKRFTSIRRVSIKRFITAPLKTLRTIMADMISDMGASPLFHIRQINDVRSKVLGRPNPYDGAMSFHKYWQWKTDQRMDEAVFNMQFITRHFLNQSPSHKIAINTIIPLYPIYVDSSFKPDSETIIEMYYLFNTYNTKLNRNLLPGLYKEYDWKRVVFVDATPIFLDSIAKVGNIFNMFLPDNPTLYQDGIHFSEKGLVKWGRLMANLMVHHNWFLPGPGFIPVPDPKYYAYLEINNYHINTMMRGFIDGAPAGVVIDRGMDFQERALRKEFPEIGANYYVKLESELSFKVQGSILEKYKELGEANGSVGAPLSDELCFGPLNTCWTKLSIFENGVIVFDPIAGARYDQYVVHPPESTHSAEPDFDTCVNVVCGSRWFEFNNYQLQAKSGTPPYSWYVVEGDLPSDSMLLENGTIYKPPTNDANGYWRAKVRMTDSKGRQVDKWIQISSGL